MAPIHSTACSFYMGKHMHASEPPLCWLASADCSAMDQSVTFRRLKHIPLSTHATKDTRAKSFFRLNAKKEIEKRRRRHQRVCFVLISFCFPLSLTPLTGWFGRRRISTLLFALDERKCNPAVPFADRGLLFKAITQRLE